MHVRSCRSINTGVSISRIHQRTSLMSSYLVIQKCLAGLLHKLVRWEVSGCTATVLWRIASRFCFKQHAEFLYSFHRAFSQCVLLASRLSIHTIVLKKSQFRRIFVLFNQESDFQVIDSLPNIIHDFSEHRLIFSVGERLMAMDVNWSTNFSGLPLKELIVPSYFTKVNVF